MIPEYLDANFVAYQYDGLVFLDALEADSVQLIWTRPLFANDLEPGATKTVAQMESIELCAAVADAASRILTATGVLAIYLSDQNIESVMAAVSKRTHLNFGGYQIDSADPDTTVLVFHREDPKFTGFSAYCGPGEDLLVAPLIEEYTEPGDTVVDPLCGTGDVVEAAVALGRVAVVNDPNPLAIQAAVDRYKELSAQ